jgi:biotin transport system permease protein
MTPIGLFRPGSSPIHRLPAGPKLLALVLAGVGSVFLHTPWQVTVGLVVVLVLYLLAELSPAALWQQVRPLWWVLVLLGVFHVVVSGWARAYEVLGVLVALVLLAALVTLTTRTTELIDAVVRVCGPLRTVGVDPERIGLLLSLGIRSVPVVVGLAQEVREAQLARGLGMSPRAFAVPLVVRSLRHADALGEALAARGIDD